MLLCLERHFLFLNKNTEIEKIRLLKTCYI